ncbi:MAG: UDP-3-O-(3-hydroxymyristoyl) glucosamine N-acyltransferase [Phycisphaerales bacterium]|nr:UDP-3-O-(3-hydroxymyristoyl) glucosamine N-acyltransferase [Phycisphaerales bacterium]
MHTLQQLADLLGVPCPAGATKELATVSSLIDATPSDLSVLTSDKYVREYKKTHAGAVLASKKVKFSVRPDVPVLTVDDAELALVKVLEVMAPPIPHPAEGIHPSAVIDPSATVGANPHIGPHVVVGAGVKIGNNVRLHPGVVIGDDSTLGDDCTLFANVVLRERITLGSRVMIHAGAILGTDGFGYRWDGSKHAKVPQIGTVVVEDDVEIGSNTCIDRAKFNETRIGKGTKIDNLVQLGHNVRVGMHAILCGQVGIAGTVTVGNGVVLGGASVVRDHVHIGDGVMAAGHSVIADDVEPKMIISGMPAIAHRQNLREQGAIRRLPELMVELRKVQELIEKYRKAGLIQE